MKPAARQERMVASLPQALQAGPRIARLLGAAAAELAAGERSLERALTLLMRSRWPGLARGWPDPDEGPAPRAVDRSELARIAALFGLAPIPGESSALFRRRLRDHVLLHRRGVTTAPAILELVASHYLPLAAPTITWQGEVARASLSIRDADGSPRSIEIELVDNPVRVTSAGPAFADDPLAEGGAPELTVLQRGLDPATPELALVAAAPIVAPEIRHVESDLRVIVVGRLDAGDRLIVGADRPPTRNGRPLDAPLIIADPTTFDEPASFFAIDEVVDGAVVGRGGRFSRSDRWTAGDAVFFRLPCGASRLSCRAVDRHELARLLDHWPDRDQVLARLPADDEAAPPIDVRLGARWREAQAATFAIRVPAEIIPWHRRENPALHWRAIARAVERGRAAGIRGLVELVPPRLTDELEASDRLRLHLGLGDRLELDEVGALAGASALGAGVFDDVSFDGAFAEVEGPRRRGDR